jgi:hypothetical protein
MPSFKGEVKLSVPCHRFAACKRSLNVAWKSTFRQNYGPTFSPTVPPFAARISRVMWTWRCLAVRVGTSKIVGGGGSHNKPIGCGLLSGACAPGPDDEEDEEAYRIIKNIYLAKCGQQRKIRFTQICFDGGQVRSQHILLQHITQLTRRIFLQRLCQRRVSPVSTL